jgi:lysyl-tRNA synthetase class 2
MEYYWAYADYEMGMDLTEELFKYVAQKTFETLKFEVNGHKVDLGKKWERYDYSETVKKFTGVDVLNTNITEVDSKLKELGVRYNKEGDSLPRAIDALWKYCRKKISGPGFLIGTPKDLSPLSKAMPANPNLTERFQAIIAGSELCNGYSELNDPVDQRERFESQQKMRDAGDKEAQMMDVDFVEALEYGMPPTCGLGFSERVFSFLLGKPVREQQIFPLMKPKDD